MKLNAKRYARWILVLSASMALFAGVLVPREAIADPLPSQCTSWVFDGNGYGGTLVVNVDASGNVTGSLSGGSFNEDITGFYDNASSKLTFIRIPGSVPVHIDQIQIYTGYLITPADDFRFTAALAGSFEAFQGTAATASRSVYGWFATC
jgi:hypothetical protein